MSDIETGGPAFPLQSIGPEFAPGYAGMTLRDYMAIHANDEDVKVYAEVLRDQQMKEFGVAILPDGWRVKAIYMHADAMLQARQQAGRG